MTSELSATHTLHLSPQNTDPGAFPNLYISRLLGLKWPHVKCSVKRKSHICCCVLDKLDEL